MSYDVWLEVNLGGDEPSRIEADDYLNYTSNVVPMWRRAMPPIADDEGGLAQTEGMLAATAAELLGRGIEAMEAEPDAYRELDPPNGWGDYDGALEFLRRVKAVCDQHPRARVAISR